MSETATPGQQRAVACEKAHEVLVRSGLLVGGPCKGDYCGCYNLATVFEVVAEHADTARAEITRLSGEVAALDGDNRSAVKAIAALERKCDASERETMRLRCALERIAGGEFQGSLNYQATARKECAMDALATTPVPPACKRPGCTKPLAYAGAEYCGAACSEQRGVAVPTSGAGEPQPTVLDRCGLCGSTEDLFRKYGCSAKVMNCQGRVKWPPAVGPTKFQQAVQGTREAFAAVREGRTERTVLVREGGRAYEATEDEAASGALGPRCPDCEHRWNEHTMFNEDDSGSVGCQHVCIPGMTVSSLCPCANEPRSKAAQGIYPGCDPATCWHEPKCSGAPGPVKGTQGVREPRVGDVWTSGQEEVTVLRPSVKCADGSLIWPCLIAGEAFSIADVLFRDGALTFVRSAEAAK